jgi:hypothetical protein
VDVTTASPAAHTVRLVDLLAELETSDATDGAYEEVVLDGQLFREIVSTLRLVACSGDTPNDSGASSYSVAPNVGQLIAASESEFLLAVGPRSSTRRPPPTARPRCNGRRSSGRSE